MPEYTYHPDLARYAHMKSTLSPWFVRLSQEPMKLLYAAQQSGGGAREYHPIKNAMHGYDIAVNSEFLRPVMAYRISAQGFYGKIKRCSSTAFTMPSKIPAST